MAEAHSNDGQLMRRALDGDADATQELTGVLTRPANPVQGLGDIIDKDAFFAHACAMQRSDDVWCWAEDGRLSRLGVGATSDQRAPVHVDEVPPATAIGVGRNSACAITTDGLTCWGEDLGGQLTAVPPISAELVRFQGLH